MSTMRAALICSVAFLALQASLVAQVRAKPLLRASDVNRPNVLTDAEKKLLTSEKESFCFGAEICPPQCAFL